ncbi:MAG: hypothetical protein LBN32_02890 [Helicobacteraceae bacterium]|nr:hypothetical protein [Helicobacteraceae bacterium]
MGEWGEHNADLQGYLAASPSHVGFVERTDNSAYTATGHSTTVANTHYFILNTAYADDPM